MWHWLKRNIRKNELPVAPATAPAVDTVLAPVTKAPRIKDRPGMVLLKSGRWVSPFAVECLRIQGANLERIVA